MGNEEEPHRLPQANGQGAKHAPPAPSSKTSPLGRNEINITACPQANAEGYHGAQVTAVARSAFLQLRLINQLRPYLEFDCLAMVTHALVTSRLDFCNALYVGLPLKMVRTLQLVQNRAARLLTGTGRYAHMTAVLRQLHWLPIEAQAQFKVLIMTYKALNSLGPGYLNERLRPYMPDRPLRCAGESLLREPSMKEIRRVNTQRRAFSAVAPNLWNSLPKEVRLAPSLLVFRRQEVSLRDKFPIIDNLNDNFAKVKAERSHSTRLPVYYEDVAQRPRDHWRPLLRTRFESNSSQKEIGFKEFKGHLSKCNSRKEKTSYEMDPFHQGSHSLEFTRTEKGCQGQNILEGIHPWNINTTVALKKTVRTLQLVQNRAARLLTGTGHYAHMTPVLRQLHWLPIEARAQFKVLIMTYKALNGLGPGYLNERLRPYMPDRPLRSAGESLLREPSMKKIRRVPEPFIWRLKTAISKDQISKTFCLQNGQAVILGTCLQCQSSTVQHMKNINDHRYADDTTLMAENEEELKSILMRVKEERAKVGLKLNIKKTKIMASGPLTSWQIDGEEMEVVTDVIFLGSKIGSDCSQEIKRCLLLQRTHRNRVPPLFFDRFFKF
ncbi:putative uncharacterized transposon-derived protein F52C9.6 [Varanus komodoensis]|nr:putative uncharacterized transposon-derived protein F52C9.6 [Varanus komodoensis]